MPFSFVLLRLCFTPLGPLGSQGCRKTPNLQVHPVWYDRLCLIFLPQASVSSPVFSHFMRLYGLSLPPAVSSFHSSLAPQLTVPLCGPGDFPATLTGLLNPPAPPHQPPLLTRLLPTPKPHFSHKSRVRRYSRLRNAALTSSELLNKFAEAKAF